MYKKKRLGLIMAFALIAFLALTAQVYAIAMIGGTIVKVHGGKRLMIIKLKSGTNKKVYLAKHCKAYVLNRPATMANFRPGQYVTVKLCNGINDDPWKAEVVMDSYSARQYKQYHTITPIHPKIKSGGFATTGGASAPNLPPVTGVYPGSISNQWPNNNQLPPQIVWGNTAKTMNANPSPWASPAIGNVVSGSTDENKGVVNYDTGPMTNDNSGGKGSVMNSNLGIAPKQGNWAAKPTGKLPTKRVVRLQGKIRQYDAGYNALYVQDFGKPVIYTVLIRKHTKILDYMTNDTLTPAQLRNGLVVKVLGTGDQNNVIRASKIRVQR